MRKFLMLSVLLVLFTSLLSFGQTRTIQHFNNSGTDRLSGYIYQYLYPNSNNFEIYTAVNGYENFPPSTIKSVSVSILRDGRDYNDNQDSYAESTSGGDLADIFYTMPADPSVLYSAIHYIFEVDYSDGTFEYIQWDDAY